LPAQILRPVLDLVRLLATDYTSDEVQSGSSIAQSSGASLVRSRVGTYTQDMTHDGDEWIGFSNYTDFWFACRSSDAYQVLLPAFAIAMLGCSRQMHRNTFWAVGDRSTLGAYELFCVSASMPSGLARIRKAFVADQAKVAAVRRDFVCKELQESLERLYAIVVIANELVPKSV
jgi:hypothetical protein